jgi:hypothetical protein
MAKGAKVDIQYFAREYGILLFFFLFSVKGANVDCIDTAENSEKSVALYRY